MSILQIYKYGEPILKHRCKPVENINEEIKNLAMNMLETMYASMGIGLAANQVGVSLRLCVIDIRPDGKPKPLILINPKIVNKKGQMVEQEEGCLSLPGIYAKVKRFQEVDVEAINIKGMPITIKGKDLLGRVLQHEIDHLDGKIFIDYLKFFTKTKIKYKIRTLKKKGEW